MEKLKKFFIGLGILFVIFIALGIIGNFLPNSNNSNSSNNNNKSKFTQEDIKDADDYITTLEATELVKERRNKCDDGSTGCWHLIIDENMWDNSVNYDVKKGLAIAWEIYTSDKDRKYFDGIGYTSGKKLFDAFGVKK